MVAAVAPRSPRFSATPPLPLLVPRLLPPCAPPPRQPRAPPQPPRALPPRVLLPTCLLSTRLVPTRSLPPRFLAMPAPELAAVAAPASITVVSESALVAWTVA